MAHRPIVPDQFIPGRWLFAGTLIAVDALQWDLAHADDPGAVRAAYRAMALTDAEIDAGLAFRAPAVQEAAASATALALTIRCTCGVVRDTAIQPPGFETDPCSCGRVWRVGVNLWPTEVVAGGGG